MECGRGCKVRRSWPHSHPASTSYCNLGLTTQPLSASVVPSVQWAFFSSFRAAKRVQKSDDGAGVVRTGKGPSSPQLVATVSTLRPEAAAEL